MDFSRIEALGWRPEVDLPSGIAFGNGNVLDGRHD
jgi:hypothetical protein